MRTALALGALLVLCACGESATTEATQAPAPAKCTTASGGPLALLEQRDFSFEPGCLEITPSQTIAIANKGAVLHNFSVEGGASVDVQPGSVGKGPRLQSGTYTIFCKYHRGRGMTGQIRVEGG